ncbi:hypothetical protein [Paraburkholderia steynii]|uniref:hypothetical protein n=1 Tax=Paraburkholderia steynii TaxID=1245441 RepID=UPI00115F7D30|nr:hypothetical protein [Paraburkholderia steynii]
MSIVYRLYRTNWSVDDVWTMLSLFADESKRPFPCAFSERSLERLSDLYRSGNDGMCGVVLGEDGQRAARAGPGSAA